MTQTDQELERLSADSSSHLLGEIRIEKLEQERRQMLDELRKKNKTA